MKRVSAFLAMAVGGSAAMAANLNVSVESGGLNAITVGPMCMVSYSVTGQLTDTNNEGLALFGFDLDFSGGDLAQANTPTTPPMNNFANNLGINNPAGFGGTIIGGNLVQVGGGQNTIKNVVTNAPFPIGIVIPDVAHSEVELVNGQLTAPAAPGVYTLTLSNLFANQIKAGETGTVFWKTEAAGVGSIGNLTITVEAGAPCQGGTPINIIGSNPPDCAIDARQPSNIDGTNPTGYTAILLNFDGPAAALIPGDFTITVQPAGTAPVISSVVPSGNDATINFASRIPPAKWTTITHNASGTSTHVGFLPADVTNNLSANPQDILALVDSLNGVPPALAIYQSDINRSGLPDPSDILRVIDLLNGADMFDPWINATLPSVGSCTP